MIKDRLKVFFNIVTCFLMLLAVAISRDKMVFGYKLINSEKTQIQTVHTNKNGSVLINTSDIAKDVKGYGGITPLEILMENGYIKEVRALKNAETPKFFGRLENSGLFSKYIGLTPREALELDVDAVVGASISSYAVIENISRAMQYVEKENIITTSYRSLWYSPKSIAAILVVLMGCIIPLFLRSKSYRWIQLTLNVLVLGLWCGTFISYSMLVNFLSQGLNLWLSAVSVLLLIVVFAYPLFGKKGHYCNWICPFGSLQELAGKCVKKKYVLGIKALKYLNYFKNGLWALLMLFMWSGLLFSWMDYEIFTAFLFREASLVVLIVALLFIALSAIVDRPYCRFVCPTGNLVRICQNTK